MSSKKVKTVLLIVLLITPVINQLLFSELSYSQRLIFILYDIMLFILGYLAMYIILGLQAMIGIMPKKILRIACSFFIGFSAFALLLYFVFALGIVNSEDDAITLAFGYALFGMMIGSYRIKTKYTAS